MKKFRSLTVSFALSFLILAGGVILIAAPLGVYPNFQTQRKIIAEEQELIAQDAANTVKNYIQGKIATLESAVSLGNLVSNKKEDQKLVLDKLLGLEPSFRQVILFSKEEEELVTASRLSTLLSGEVMKYDKEQLFSEVGQGKNFTSPVYIDDLTSEPMVVMAIPVKDALGNFEDVLVAEINLKFMWDIVNKIKVGQSGLAYVVNVPHEF